MTGQEAKKLHQAYGFTLDEVANQIRTGSTQSSLYLRTPEPVLVKMIFIYKNIEVL